MQSKKSPLYSVLIFFIFTAALLINIMMNKNTVFATSVKDYIKTNKNSEIFIKDNALFFYGVKLTTKGGDFFEGQRLLTATYKDKNIIKEYSLDGDIADAKIENNFPSQGMTALIFKLWNGGAVCCWGQVVFVKNGNNIIYALIDEGRIPDDVKNQKNGTIKIFDNRLLQFQASKGNTFVAFAPGDALLLPRFIVFENNSWRADKEGELSAAYKKMENEYIDRVPAKYLKQDKDVYENELQNANVYNAMMRTFFCLMEGGPDEHCRTMLQQILNEKSKPLYRQLWAGVVEKVMCFKPIHESAIY
mgnify:CR=1 FL=1